MNKKNIDLTVGNPLNLLIAFTLPALASNLLNQVYSITDSRINPPGLWRTAGKVIYGKS